MDDSHNTDVEESAWTQADELESEDNGGKSAEETVERILHLLHRYWQKRKLAFGIIAAGIVLSVAYSLMLPNYYLSTTTLMPQDNASPYSSMLGAISGSGAASLGSDALGLSTPGELLTSILESRTARNEMVEKFDLVNYYHLPVGEAARKYLTAVTKIDEDRKTGIITIAVTDKSPDFACKLAQGYVDELNHILTKNSTSSARRERMFLEERVKDVKRDLDESSMALSQFSTKNKAMDLTAQARAMIEASLRIQALLAESESQLAALKETYASDNYRVKAMEARNAELLRQFNSMGGTSRTSAPSAGGNIPFPSVGDFPGLGLTYFDLERKVRVDEALWEALTKQYEMARVQEAKEIPTIRVLDAANVPLQKAGPRRSLIVLAVTFISFLLSLLVVFGSIFWEEMEQEALPKKLYARFFSKKLVPQQ